MQKLTLKTFFMLLALCLVICFVTYMFMWIFLPIANEKQSRHLLEEKTETLVNQLRRAKTFESEAMFINFIQETGADVSLMNQNREPVSLFTFLENESDIMKGTEYPFRFADSKEEYILIISYNPARSKEIADALRRSLPFVGGIIVLISFFSALFVSYYTTRPIIRVSKIANRIANLDFSWYCPDVRDDEIGELAGSINELSDRLYTALTELNSQNALLADEITFEKERERRRMLFFSGVSHELKTPIAIVIGQLEGMQAEIGVYKDREKYLARSAEILQSLNSFIKEILSVSHIDMEGQEQVVPVHLSVIMEELLNDYHDFMDLQEVQLLSDVEEDIFVYGNEQLFKKALGNVMGNAIEYSSENGTVSVTLTKNSGKPRLTITNSPAHIDEEHLPHIYEAFYRAGKETGHGSGLGLYILRMILETYGIGYSITNREDGVQFVAEFEEALI